MYNHPFMLKLKEANIQNKSKLILIKVIIFPLIKMRLIFLQHNLKLLSYLIFSFYNPLHLIFNNIKNSLAYNYNKYIIF